MLHFELARSIHNQLVLVDSGYIIFKASQTLYNICQSNMNQKQSCPELFGFGNPERIPKNSDSRVRSELYQFGRSENPEQPNPENITRRLKIDIL